MSVGIDRRSFRLGAAAAALILIAGIALGIGLSARLDWLPIANGEAPQDALPLKGPTPPDFVPVVKAATPAVVNISTMRTVRSSGPGELPAPFMDDPFFRHFFGDEFFRRFQIPRERREASLGSGVIVSSDGYIVTNNHVIAKADQIKVLLVDKREFTGKVVGTDPKSDIAVVKIEAKNLPTLPWGDSDRLEVGEYVLAIGNPFGLNQTVTMGIVSAVGRANVGIADYEDFIQTDAAINPGNSGGALINARGELVGINTAIFTRSGGYMGIGFAVPSNMARTVMESLIKHGKVIRGWLGVSIQPLSDDLAKQFGLKEPKGALVGEVFPDSPAAEAGLKTGDVIVGYNGKEIDSPNLLRNLVAQTPVGSRVKVEIVRDGQRRSLTVKIGEQPKENAEAGEQGAPGGEENALAGLEVRDLTADIARQLGLPPGSPGVVVTGVDPDSAAAAAGIEEGDVIVEVNRQRVRHVRDFRSIVSKLGKNDRVLLLIQRRGSKLFVLIKP